MIYLFESQSSYEYRDTNKNTVQLLYRVYSIIIVRYDTIMSCAYAYAAELIVRRSKVVFDLLEFVFECTLIELQLLTLLLLSSQPTSKD